MIPITLYAEMTPNPNTMKFVANKYLLLDERTVEFVSLADTKGYSPLAEALFQFPFVKSVFLSSNFITVTKDANIDWDFIVMELRDFIREWLMNGKEILIRMPEESQLKNKAGEIHQNSQPLVPEKEFAPSEFDEPIRALLNEYVKPAVENDGGAIEYVGFENGTVTVKMKGSCSGCPSSTATLKGGIENLLRSHLDAVKEVVALSA